MILLEVNIVETLVGLAIGIVVTGFVSLIVYVFNQNRSDTKSRIDARATEADELYDKYSDLNGKVQSLETRVGHMENQHNKLENTIRENHAEVTKRLDAIFTKIIEASQK